MDITKGDWKARQQLAGQLYDIVSDSSNWYIAADVIEANAQLIKEAGTVANETELMPRQMKEQRDELLAACEDFLKLWPEMRICNASEGKNGCAGCRNEVCIRASELKGKFLKAKAIAKAEKR